MEIICLLKFLHCFLVALVQRLQPRQNGDQDYDDNASETSSVCSERSFTSRSRLPSVSDPADLILIVYNTLLAT